MLIRFPHHQSCGPLLSASCWEFENFECPGTELGQSRLRSCGRVLPPRREAARGDHLDKRVLCLDGVISPDADFSLAGAQKVNGLFVVRNIGGFTSTAVALANMVRDRRATVVVYDYCVSACASFLLVASDEAFVMKGTIVAWHHTSWPFCPTLEESKDGGPKRLEKPPCADTSLRISARPREAEEKRDEFYADRVVDPLFQDPPQSFTMRKRLRSMFEGSGRYPDVVWTWNPRYYASTLKTKITYEAYPSSQDEVDALVLKFFDNGRLRVLYDP